jgi:SNF2 family DNA or RNA helicase
LKAEVSGSAHRSYRPVVRVQMLRNGRARFIDRCNCALGGGCKHVVALLLAALPENNIEGTAIGTVAATLAKLETQGRPRQEVIAALKNAAAELGMSLHPASQARAPEALPPELERWLKAVGSASTQAASTATQCLLYQLESLAGEPMGVQVLHARILKTGGYAAVKPFASLETAQYSPPAYFAEVDAHIVRDLMRMARQSTGYTGRLTGPEGAHALSLMLQTGRSFVGDESALEKAVWLSRGLARPGFWTWLAKDDGAQQLQLGTTPACQQIIATAPPYYVDLSAGECGEVSLDIAPKLAAALAAAPPVPVQHADDFALKLAELAPANAVPPPPHLRVQPLAQALPVPILQLYGEEPRSGFARARAARHGALRLLFDYEGVRLHWSAPDKPITRKLDDGSVRQLQRHRSEEQRRAMELRALAHLVPVAQAFQSWEAPNIDHNDLTLRDGHMESVWQDFQTLALPKLEASGWQIEIDLSFPFRFVEAQQWYGEISEERGKANSDWFSVELGVMVQGERVNLLPILLAALRADTDYFRALVRGEVKSFTAQLPHGQRLVLPAARIQALVSTLLEMAEGSSLDGGKLRLSSADAARLAEFEAANPELSSHWIGGAERLAMGRALQQVEHIEAVLPPWGLAAQLRGYQQTGLNWLQFLRRQGLSGILADDMGLGKTVQAIAHILLEKEQGRLTQPVLIVAPTSLMGNWRREAQKFAPSLTLVTLHGAGRRQHYADLPEADVVLTTYALLRFDEEILLRQHWHLVVLDEAQNIKNATSATAKVARALKAHHRLCLTGTPLENHLGELWSQFHFLMPGFLGTEKDFKRLYRTPIEKHGDDDKRARLARRIAPFLLRRTKQQVAPELPPKTEIIRSVALSGAQRDLYETLRLSLNEKLRQELSSLGLGRSQIMVLDALLKLRQVCCDPRLVKLDAAEAAAGESAKLDLLIDLLNLQLMEGRKVLLFSQFTSMLRLIEERLAQAGHAWAKLTGETNDRDAEVERFQSGKVSLFLLSLKAGGVGLNLTAADTVIHYDPWWNPAAENQATDRAHRIGQDKPVFVYKLLVEGSVEERIQALQARKSALFAGIVGHAEGEIAGSLDAEDIAELLRPLN